MATSILNPKVDFFFKASTKWKAAYEQLRMIALDCGLTEELKWGCPCYTRDKHNVVLIHGFKDYCAFLFFKGALMKDPKGMLIQQTANVQSARQIRFTDVKEIVKKGNILKAYIKEATAIEEAGLKVELRKSTDFTVAEEFQKQLKKNAKLNAAFNALTPGRQRAYLLHFSSAKQSATREARIEKCMPLILSGKGLTD